MLPLLLLGLPLLLVAVAMGNEATDGLRGGVRGRRRKASGKRRGGYVRKRDAILHRLRDQREKGMRLRQALTAPRVRDAAEAAGRPYPGRWAMIFAALVGVNVSPHRQCYQHSAHVLNAAGPAEPYPEAFFASPAAMDDAAMGRDPRFERAAVVGKDPL